MEKHDLAFWLSAFGATALKIFTSEYGGPLRLAVTVFAALFSAYVFTVPAMNYMDLDPEVYTIPMASVLCLTGESLMRWVMKLMDALPSEPSKILELIRQWRRGK